MRLAGIPVVITRISTRSASHRASRSDCTTVFPLKSFASGGPNFLEYAGTRTGQDCSILEIVYCEPGESVTPQSRLLLDGGLVSDA